jgi:hypothetical protein
MPVVAMSEKVKLGEFHMLEVTVTYTDEDVKMEAAERGLNISTADGLQRSVEAVLFEERKALVAAAIKSGVLDLDVAKAILQVWKPKGTE